MPPNTPLASCETPINDLDEGLAYLSRQIREGPDGRLRACPLKTESSRRVVAFAPQTVTVLRAHRSWQGRWLSESGIETQGWVFTDEIGRPLSPDRLTRTFNRLVEESGLPPVRLHDLRHGAATLMLIAGDKLKTIADQLGHSSVRGSKTRPPALNWAFRRIARIG